MKWQKWFLLLAGSGAAISCVALLGLVLTSPLRLYEFWEKLADLFWHGPGLLLPTNTLPPATWWTVCAVATIDLLYLLWFRRRGRTFHSVDGTSLSSRRYLSAKEYEALLRQRHAALLARYQDPGLVQFLLNREAARAQRLEQWFEGSEGWTAAETNPTATLLPASEREARRQTKRPALAMLVNPLGA